MSTRLPLASPAGATKVPRPQQSKRGSQSSTRKAKDGKSPVASPMSSPNGVEAALDPMKSISETGVEAGNEESVSELLRVVNSMTMKLEAARDREIALIKSEASALAKCEVLQEQVTTMQQQIVGLIGALNLALDKSTPAERAEVEASFVKIVKAKDAAFPAKSSTATQAKQPPGSRKRNPWRIAGLKMIAIHRMIQAGAVRREKAAAKAAPTGRTPAMQQHWRMAGLKMLAVYLFIQAGKVRREMAAATAAKAQMQKVAPTVSARTPAMQRHWRMAGLKMLAVYHFIQAGKARRDRSTAKAPPQQQAASSTGRTPAMQRWRIAGLKMLAVHRMIEGGKRRPFKSWQSTPEKPE